MELIILQAVAVVFGFACGRHDVPAVDNFTQFGSSTKHQKAFHGFNLVLKGCFIAVVFICTHSWAITASCWLLVYAIFDPTVAIFRTIYSGAKRAKRPWYYLSENSNFFDRLMLHVLGKKAGIWKFLICIALVVILNVLAAPLF